MVRVDGREVGRTPWSNPGGLALGEYAVELAREDYDVYDTRIEVTERGLSSWSYPLARSTGSVIWEVEPVSTCYVLAAQKDDSMHQGVVGEGELELPTGKYDLTLSRDGWPDQTQSIDISANISETVRADFREATIVVASEPACAAVLVAGQEVGRTPYRLEDQVPGTKTYALRLEGYIEGAVEGPALPGRQLNLSASLEIAHFEIQDLGIEMRYIEPGAFMMGSLGNEEGRGDDELQYEVTLTQPFWLGATEVTQGQWQALMKNNSSLFKNMGQTAPVEMVSWEDAMQCCQKLTKRERAAGRLPLYVADGGAVGICVSCGHDGGVCWQSGCNELECIQQQYDYSSRRAETS